MEAMLMQLPARNIGKINQFDFEQQPFNKQYKCEDSDVFSRQRWHWIISVEEEKLHK